VVASRDALEQARQLLQPQWPALLRSDLPGTTAGALFTRGEATEDALGLAAEQIRLVAESGDWRREISARNTLADATWMLGRVDEACRQFSANVARLRTHAPVSLLMSYSLGNLLGTLSELGRAEEALLVARDALPFMRRCGQLQFFAETFIHILVAHERHEAAARLVGMSDACYARLATLRQPNEERLIDSARTRLQSVLDPATLERCVNEGAKLDDDAVYAIVEAALA
jgi:hypothetical protein